MKTAIFCGGAGIQAAFQAFALCGAARHLEFSGPDVSCFRRFRPLCTQPDEQRRTKRYSG